MANYTQEEEDSYQRFLSGMTSQPKVQPPKQSGGMAGAVSKYTPEEDASYNKWLNSYSTQKVEPEETSGDVITGLKRGIQQTQAMGYGAVGLAGSAIGIDPVQKWGFEGYERNIKEAEKYPKKHTFKDVYTGEAGIGGAIDWAQGTLGELVPSMVEAAMGAAIGSFVMPGGGTAAGGLAGRTILKKAIEKTVASQIKKGIIKKGSKEALEKGVNLATKNALKKFGGKVGMGAAVLPMEAGGNYGSLLAEKGIDAPGTALLFGALATSLEYLGGNSRLIDTFIDGVGTGKGKLIKRAAKNLLTNMPEEALQEGGQEVFSILNEIVNTDEKFLTGQHVEEIVESMGAGAVGGGAGAFIQTAMPGKKETVIKQPPTDTETINNLKAGLDSGKITPEQIIELKKDPANERLFSDIDKLVAEHDDISYANDTPEGQTLNAARNSRIMERLARGEDISRDTSIPTHEEIQKDILTPEEKQWEADIQAQQEKRDRPKTQAELNQAEINRTSFKEPEAEKERVKSLQKKTVHDHTNTQVEIKGDVARKIQTFASNIPDSELYTKKDDNSYGRETEPHITVKYGLATNNPSDVQKIVESHPPIVATMGDVSIFKNEKYDVIKVEVESPELNFLNKKIAEEAEIDLSGGETFKYSPHATIAYVKPGEGKKYIKDKTFNGEEITFNEITVSTKDGKMHQIPLTGKPLKPTLDKSDEKIPETKGKAEAKELKQKDPQALIEEAKREIGIINRYPKLSDNPKQEVAEWEKVIAENEVLLSGDKKASETETTKQRIEKSASKANLEKIQEKGSARFANPEAVAEKINKYTDVEVEANLEYGTVELKDKSNIKSEEPKVKAEKKSDKKKYLIEFAPEDIDYDLAYSAHTGSSFSPEKRAEQEQQGYYEQMKEVHDYFLSKIKPEQEGILSNSLERYKQGYLKKKNALLAAESRTMSSMITGPSNFPVRSNQKKLDTANRRLTELIEWDEKAQRGIERDLGLLQTSISSDDPQAIQKLKTKLQNLEEAHKLMKDANKIVRSKKLSDKEKTQALLDAGYKSELVKEIMSPDYAGSTGFAGFELSNSNANIKRVKGRITELEKRAGDKTESFEINGVEIIDNVEDNRVQIVFDGKPSEEIRKELKSNGFKWSPKKGVWQRQRNTQVVGIAKSIVAKHQKDDYNIIKEGGVKNEIKESRSQESKQPDLFDYKPEKQEKAELRKKLRTKQEVSTAPISGVDVSSQRYNVQSEKDVASLFSHLVATAEERAYFLIVDKNGDVLEILQHSAGGKGSSIIDPSVAMGRVFNNKKAKKVFFVHNHPAGSIDPSIPDQAILEKIEAIASLRDISVSALILGNNEFSTFEKTGEFIPGTISKTVKKSNLPIEERVFKKRVGKYDVVINNEGRADLRLQDEQDGFLLLDGSMQEVGFLPFPSGLPQKEIVAQLIAATEKTNAQVVIVNSKPIKKIDERNDFLTKLPDALEGINITVADVLRYEKDGVVIHSIGTGGSKYAIKDLDSDRILYATTQDISSKQNTKEKTDALYQTKKRNEISTDRRSIQGQRLYEALGYRDSNGTTKTVSALTKSRKQIKKIAKSLGYNAVFFTSKNSKINKVTGFIIPGVNDEIYINANSSNPLISIVGHETIHQLKQNHPDLYDFLADQIEVKSENFKKYVKRLNLQRDDHFSKVENEEVLYEELIGDFASDQFQRPEFWQKLHAADPTFTEKIIKIIKKVLKKIEAVFPRAEKYISNIHDAQDALVFAMGEMRKRGVAAKGSGEKVQFQTFALGDPWYSQLTKSVESIQQKAMPAPQWKAILKSNKLKQQGVKEEEIEWSGVNEWLDSKKGKVTKQEVVDYLNENQVVFEEVVKEDTVKGAEIEAYENFSRDFDEQRGGEYSWLNDVRQEEIDNAWFDEDHVIWKSLGKTKKSYLKELDNEDAAELFEEEVINSLAIYEYIPEDRYENIKADHWDDQEEAYIEGVTESLISPTEFSQYQLPGGENYKEFLLRVPEKIKALSFADFLELKGIDSDNLSYVEQRDLVEEFDARHEKRKKEIGEAYKSPHYDESNIIAHIRASERVVDGKKVLHIEEVQSDQGQAYRKELKNIDNSVTMNFKEIVKNMEQAGTLKEIC